MNTYVHRYTYTNSHIGGRADGQTWSCCCWISECTSGRSCCYSCQDAETFRLSQHLGDLAAPLTFAPGMIRNDS